METNKVENLSDVFQTIKNMDEKISHLFKILNPVIQSIPTKSDGAQVGYATNLSSDLHGIDARLANLIDSIQL